MEDALDRKLIFELNWNCRLSYSELAKKLHTSKQVVRYRILNLERSGIIMSYHALIDWRTLGYNSVRIYLKWHNIDDDTEKKVHDEIRQDPFFMWSIRFEGDFDLAFYVWVRSIAEFSEKWFEFLARYKKYILNYEIYESVNMINYPMKYLLADEAKTSRYEYAEKVIGNASKKDYDDVDYKILKLLTQNASASVVSIAKNLRLTPKAIIYRMRRLEKEGIILGYNALIDTKKLGYMFYKLDFYLNDLSKLNEMFSFAKLHKLIVYRMRTIGGADFEIEVVIKTMDDIKNLVSELKKRFSGSIETYRMHRFDYTIKQVYLPGVKL